MIIAYLVALILVMPILVIHELMMKSKNSKRKEYTMVMIYTVIIFLVITGLRDTATISIEHYRQSDELTYRRTFDMLIGTRFSLLNVNSFEWLRYVLDWTLANVFKSSQIWVFTYAFITNFLYVYAIRKYVKPFWVGIFLYITVGVFIFQMNGTTTVLASAILLQSFRFAIERKFWKYLFVVFIASGIHFSAWVMLPLYFVLTKKFFTKGTPIWIMISILFMFGFNSIANFILPKTPYAHYLYQINGEEIQGVNVLRIITFVTVYFFILTFTKKIKNFSSTDRYFTNMIIILLTINIASGVYVYIYRFNEIFIFALIYMLPRIIYSFRSSIRYFLLLVFLLAFFIFGIQQSWNILYENILFK
ncbi:hypothetical protein BBI11_13090 [Planococcus maritimus]|uniref:EpsG family protein n=1 Tax=Planococcus maritimus TaxID=192421 RepID=UPI00080F2362|nr:EpsG family protein [Planococcus maritimus]ANU17909.1 hypothetical protein BBI11_13090 [Planococcus maritimus]